MLDRKDATRLINSGDAETMLREFIVKSHVLALRAEVENADALTKRAYSLDLVAAVALEILLKTPDGRRALKLKRRARGQDFRAIDYVTNPAAVDIALKVHRGLMDRGAALAALDKIVSTDVVCLDSKTLERLLTDLVNKVAHNLDITEIFRGIATGKPQEAAEVEETLRFIYKNPG